MHATRIVLAAALLLLAATGCQGARISARNSVNPLLLGPVKTLGPGAPVEADAAGAFDTESSAFHASSSSTSSSTSGGVTTTTTTTSSSTYRSPGTQTDFDLLVASSGEPSRFVVLERLDCGAYAFNALVGIMAETWCRARGRVYQPREAVAEGP